MIHSNNVILRKLWNIVMISKRSSLQADLQVFLIIIATLILIGCLFVYSSSSVYALETFGSPLFFIKRQMGGLIVGCIGLLISQLLPINFWKKSAPFLFVCSLCLLVATLFPSLSRSIHGSSRWLSLFGLSFQPSEILKITLVLYTAYFFEKNMYKRYISYKQLFFFCVTLAVMSITLLKQPDFGMTISLLLTVTILFFCTRATLKHGLIIGTLLSITSAFLIFIKPYRIQRVMIFLNPWQDPKGSGFQIIQSLIAIGGGNWLGKGIGHSKQKFFYLPMQHTDFIFSIIAEETGFIGCIFLLLLFFLCLYFGIRIVHQLKDTFSSLTVLGFVSIIHLQTVMNLAVASGLAPTKGVGMPFISYGNTALVCYLFMIGVIIKSVRNQNSSI